MNSTSTDTLASYSYSYCKAPPSIWGQRHHRAMTSDYVRICCPLSDQIGDLVKSEHTMESRGVLCGRYLLSLKPVAPSFTPTDTSY